MNKLDTTLLGGFPFDLNDLEWQFNAYNRAFKDLFDGIGQGFILHGCEATLVGVNTYDISAGAIVLAGEVYVYAGATGVVILQPEEAWFVVSATLDGSGAEIFEDLVTRNAYQLRVATVVQSASAPAAPYMALFGPRLAQVLQGQLQLVELPWTAIALVGDWAQGGLPYSRPEYRRETGRIVRLRGAVNGTSSTSTTLGVLPVGFRPSGVMRFPLTSISNPAITRIAQIDTSGNIQVVIASPGADDVYDLCAVPPFEAIA